MNLHDIDYLGCPEINLDATQQTVQQTLKNITKAAFSQSSIQFGSTPISAKHFYKPGGTMCIVKGDINSRKIDQGSDKYAYKPYIASSTTRTTTYHQELALQQIETSSTGSNKFTVQHNEN
eukprot:7641802-Ditylum_brightwellii.AAC.1